MKHILPVLLISAVAASAAPQTIASGLTGFSLDAPNGRKHTSMGGRVYTVAKTGSSILMASSADGVNWAQSPVPGTAGALYPAIGATNNTVAVVFQKNGDVNIMWCIGLSNGVCNNWTGMISLGAGTTPTITGSANDLFVVWMNSERILARQVIPSLYVVDATRDLTGTSMTGMDYNRLPTVVAWRNPTNSNLNRVTVHWLHLMTGVSPVWALRKVEFDGSVSGIINQTAPIDRTGGPAPVTNMFDSLDSSINTANGKVTVVYSVVSNTGGRMALMNETGQVHLSSLRGWITVDSFQGCAAANARVGVRDIGGATYTRLVNRDTLTPLAGTALPWNAFAPVAIAWGRYTGGYSNSTSFTDLVESIHGINTGTAVTWTADARRQYGFQPVPYCAVATGSGPFLQ